MDRLPSFVREGSSHRYSSRTRKSTDPVRPSSSPTWATRSQFFGRVCRPDPPPIRSEFEWGPPPTRYAWGPSPTCSFARTFSSASAVARLLGATVLGAIVIGCGGAPARPDADEAFHRIQVHEATIAHRSADAARCAPDAPCPAAVEVCDAAEALCAIATELGDPDALTRCDLARRHCGDPAEPRA